MTSANADAFRDSASDALEQVQSAAAPAIKEGKRQAGVLLDQSGELIDKVSDGATETAADLGNRIVAYTKSSPITALIMAVGAGALLVSIVRSLRSRR